MVTRISIALVLSFSSVACGARTVADETVDGAIDVIPEDVADAAPDVGHMPDADPGAPIPNTFPASGGSCVSSKCFGDGDSNDVVCDFDTGWCCAGNFTSTGCQCGESRGCIPPYVCCRTRGEVIRQCKPISECASR